MHLNDPKFQQYVETAAAEILAQLGYEPLRDLPWRPVTPPAAPFVDSELESDLRLIRAHADRITSQLQDLNPATDRFSLVLEGDPEALHYHATLAEAQQLLQAGASRIAAAGAKYDSLAAETVSDVERLTQDDVAYIHREFDRRSRLAEELIAYCSDPDAAASPPRDIDGKVVSPVVAEGLVQRYVVDAMCLKSRLETESDLDYLDQLARDLSQILGWVGSNGMAYIKAVSKKLEKSRRGSIRWRRAGMAALSLLLVVAGVWLDRFFTSDDVLGNLIWVSIGAGLVVWFVDKASADYLDLRLHKRQLQIISSAVNQVATWLTFLRAQQAHLNSFLVSVDKVPVQFATEWD